MEPDSSNEPENKKFNNSGGGSIDYHSVNPMQAVQQVMFLLSINIQFELNKY